MDIPYELEGLINSAKNYLSRQESFDLIIKAYEYAKEKHNGQYRKSGEPYIVHPYAVADILVSLHAGPKIIAAGLLHDVVEDCNVTLEEITKEFDAEIASLIDSVTKIGNLKSNMSLADFQADNHRKIFIAMAKDIRVIFIKLADRLSNMRTLEYLSEEKQKKIAKESLEIYAPIAHRLGLSEIKTEIENLSLYYLEREKYLEIENLLNTNKEEREKSVAIMKDKIEALLLENKIPCIISGRTKSIYSIYKKIYFRGVPFDNIYDILALRVITKTEVNCYEILGYIHATYRPLPGRFKDYIAMPKPNLYQSLHTAILNNDGNIFEVQIRTDEMDNIAEKGVAAHWRYKENIEYDSKKQQKEIEEKLHWFRDFVVLNEESNDDDDDSKDIVESLKKDVFEANVYVLSPKGKVIDLPSGSTPVDFAYRIHTQVGHNIIGATINGNLVPLNSILKTGDVVNIKTSKHNTLPSEGWLNFVKTNNAKNSIKKELLRAQIEQQKDDLIQKGKQQLIEVLKERNINEDEAIKSLSESNSLQQCNFNNIDDLFVAIATNSTSVQSIIDKGIVKSKKSNILNFLNRRVNNVPGKKYTPKGDVIVDGIDTVLITFANCCNPVPGDGIVGYISKGMGIKVHRSTCQNIQKEKKRFVAVRWNESQLDKNKNYNVDLEIKASDRPNLLVDLMNKMSSSKVSITTISAKSFSSTSTATISMSINVSDINELNKAFSLLENIKGVFEVKRLNRN